MVACTSCGAKTPPAARYCPECGARTAPERESLRVITVLFCDVVDSTPITEGDPEAARRVISGYFDEVRAVIARHGGMIEKFIGDEVLGVFGIPQAHEDDALRAARAAVDIRSAVASLNARLESIRLSVRIGVNTGQVVAGDPSTGHGFLTGDAVVVGKRLEQVASPGEILIGDGTYALVRDAVVVEDAGEVALKGKSAPVAARRLLAVMADAPGINRRLGSELVGRERELALLRHAFDGAAQHARGHLFSVLGPAGVGKSRLVRELVADVGDQAIVLAGRCLAYGEGITFWPLLDVVRQAAGIPANASPENAQRLIAAAVGESGQAETVAAIVAGAVGVTDAAATAQDSFWAIRRLLESVARDRPLVLIFDDVHWGEPTFLDLVEYLGEAARDEPMLILCLARPELLELRPTWGGGRPNASSILLEPLGTDEASRLIDNLAATWLDEAARRTIVAAAEGNPFYIEEMVAVSRERDTLSVPPTIQALLAARLDNLDPAERAIIEAAAVAGKSFRGRAVEALVGDGEVDSALASLTRKELVRRQADASDDDPWFRFRHMLIRDAAYDATPKQRRAQLHERFAEWLEADAGDRFRELEEIVGYHFEQAHRLRTDVGLAARPELALRAGRLLAGAGGRAFAREDMPAARALLERAVALLPEDDASRLEAQRRLGSALWATGAFERARETLDAVIGASVATGERRVEWYARLARAGFSRQSGELEATTAHAIEVFAELGDDLGLARAWRRLAFVSMAAGRNRAAEEEAERAIEHARRAGDRGELARAADIFGMSLLNGPVPAGEAAKRCEALLAEADGNILMEANVAGALAPLYALCDRGAEAEAVAQRVRAWSDEIANALARAGLGQMLGLVALLRDDPATAERELRSTLEVLPPLAQAQSLVLLAEAVRAQGRLDEAEAIAAGVEATDVPTRVRLAVVRARLAAAADRDAALVFAEAAVELAAEVEEPNLQADAFSVLSEAQAARGEPERAQESLGRAAVLYEAKGNVRAARTARAALVSGVSQG